MVNRAEDRAEARTLGPIRVPIKQMLILKSKAIVEKLNKEKVMTKIDAELVHRGLILCQMELNPNDAGVVNKVMD